MRIRSVVTALVLAVTASAGAAAAPTAVQAAEKSSAEISAALDAELVRLAAAGNPGAAMVLRSRTAPPRDPQLKQGPLSLQERSSIAAAIRDKRAGGGFQVLDADCSGQPWHYMLHGETNRNLKIQGDLKAYAIGQASFEPWYQWVLPCYDYFFEDWAFWSNRGGWLTAPAFQQMYISGSLTDAGFFLWGSYDGNWDYLFAENGGGWYVSGHTSETNHPIVADTWPLNGTALWKVRPI